MPHITTAMEWSRRRGMGEILLDSFLRRRSITGQAAGVRDSFSSWSKCMEATYCKWPVIAIIAIAGLFVFSVLWCVIRCACCGMSCCCTCFSFLKCCNCCGGLCEGKRDRSHKHLDGDPPPPNPTQGYQAPAPMMGGVLPARPEPPRYAQFEVGKNGLAVDPPSAISEDALPPMPTWDNAAKIHVLDEEKGGEGGMELKELDPATGQKMPLMVGGAANSHPSSPAVGPGEMPYGRQGRGMGNGLMNPQKPYNRSQNNLSGNGRGFGPGGSPNPGMTNDPLMGYRGPGSAMGMRDAGRGYTGMPPPGGRGYRGGPSPGPGMNHGPGQFRGGPSPAPSRGYGGSAPNEDFEQPAMPQEFPSSDGGFNDAAVSRYGNQPHLPQPPPQFSDDSSRPLNPGRSSTDNTDQSYQSMQSDNSSNVGTYPPPHMSSREPGPNGPNRMMSPVLQSGGYGAPHQRGFDGRSPAPMQQQSRFGQDQGGYNQGTQRNMPRSLPRQQPSAYPGYKPYTPELEAPAYPGYKPYTPELEAPAYPGYKPYIPGPR